ncbi:PPK2 family polyphosphate kinase [Enterovirga rhinocerotis]|uniref:PPK2 family polyphosphate:nucleotide phosphotransferase n=1 Tax=Enterovirga rhinocerotis TaxID=1339210 RepID=A0A4R7C8P2_9HYPH|nr:PPK2 family polyphosphate kinase [Enterovirga rhinocerotis]TDR94751.1 PPK2 family polyphosphate:nucleotide phosphotransferase [Enterovirga rhinocerotis]
MKSVTQRARDLRRRFHVKPHAAVDLEALDPAETSHVGDKETAKAQTEEDALAIDALQDRLFAEGRRALLVILQGMDTSGKDGTTRAVFGRTGPLGVSVTSFKKPSEVELSHDFLWRVHKACPQRGTIGIFNRSQYEDVLIGRVRKLASREVIEHRYEQINAFEDMISSSTHIVKFMLHISKDEQKERLQSRLDNPDKNWKFDPSDVAERKLWDDYLRAYETMLQRCSTAIAPWYVIPADKKWARNAAVATIVRATLEEMDPQYPKVDFDPAAITID